jgi:FkbM family methyltransferase
MSSSWYDLPSVRKLPMPHRVYGWWSKHGVKRGAGLVYGGNKLFSIVRLFYKLFPRRDNFAEIPAWDGRLTMIVDLLDFEVAHHTLPLAIGISDETRLLQLLLPPGGTFFDVGANYGFYALMASHIGGPESTVCAFEPQPRLAEALRISKQANQFSQLRLFEMALGDQDGAADFFIPDTGSGVGSVFREHASQTRPVKQTTVKIATLDSVFRNESLERLDVIKIDVEGAELEVLRGARETLGLLHPFVWFEMNPVAQRRAGHDQEDVYSLLEQLGYEEFFDVAEFVLGTRKPIRTVDTLTNVLAVPGKGKPNSSHEPREKTLSL